MSYAKELLREEKCKIYLQSQISECKNLCINPQFDFNEKM